MECKFVIGQRVVAVREKCYPCEMCRSDDKSRGATVRQGGRLYSVDGRDIPCSSMPPRSGLAGYASD